MPLGLPPLKKLEAVPDPKNLLYDALKKASNLHGRRLKSFPVRRRVLRVLDFVEDFSPLRTLSAFNALEEDVARVVKENNW